MSHPKLNLIVERVSITYASVSDLTQSVQRIGTDRLSLHDFSDRLKSLQVEVEADDAYGCGWCGIVDVWFLHASSLTYIGPCRSPCL